MDSKTKFSYTMWILASIAIIVLFIYERRKIDLRIKNANYTIGILTDITKNARGSTYVDYTFFVNNKEYNGSVSTQFCKGCKNKCCEIGSKLKVRYDKYNPSNNDLVKE